MEPLSITPGCGSCTDCVYRSRSKQPNIQQLLEEGSDIDKLYLGKFLPLRERKLLEKLIRTRDVYDDVRNKLLSSSDQAIPKHKKKRRDEDLSSEQSSAVLKMVNLVDRGQMGSANASKVKLNSCCSYCSCGTLSKIRKRMEKEDRKHPKVHRQIVTCEDIAKYCEEAAIKGRKRRRKLSTKLSSKIGSARLKIKKNLSEPTVVSMSRAFMKRIRSKRKTTDSAEKVENQQTKTTKHKRKREKNIQRHSSKDSGTETTFLLADKIKKDSLILFKEKLLKKRPYEKNKHVECRPGTCKAGTCVPEECIDKIKSKRVGDKRKRKHHSRHSEVGRQKSRISMKIRPRKVKERESQVKVSKVKSSSSLTTILKTREMKSLSKMELKGKIPVSTKPVKGKLGKALAKSAASMISIPEMKAKGTEERAAQKLKYKTKRRHVGKVKESTAKPATKSTSSFTSVPQEKDSKRHSKNIKTLERHEREPAPSLTRYKTGRQKPRLKPDQEIQVTDIQEPIDTIKPKKEKRMKRTHGTKLHQKYKHSTTQFSVASAKASKHSNMRDSGSQASKPRGRNVLSKSKSQGKPAMASVERSKRKSVGNAYSQKSSSRSGTKSKHKQSKSAENVTRKRKYTSKEPPPETDENIIESYPNRQAVKISSSFSFDIEFYKDSYPCVEVTEQPDIVSSKTPRPRKRMKQTQHRRKYKDHGSGHVRSLQNTSSQSDSTQSFKSTQVAHKLKRCFCTQKLIQTKKLKISYDESKKTMAALDSKDREVVAREIRTQTKKSGNAYVVSPTSSTQTSLLLYKCESGVCTPAECDTYECLEKIKQRNRGAGTTEAPRKYKVAYTSPSESKSTSSKVQSGENRKIKRKRQHSQNVAYSPRSIEPKVSSDGLEQRQAVRISSNFNFSVEFSKTRLNDRVAANAVIYDRPIQIKRRHIQPKGIKVYKPRVRHETSETTRKSRHEASGTTRKLRHETSEIPRTAKKTKLTHTEPFLQRCLCTLKLLKKNKKIAEKSPWRNRDEYVMHMQNRAENRYNPERSKLLPYECEPGLCIPKKYRPYDCEKPTKFAHIKSKHKYSQISDISSLSIFSKTSETTTSFGSQYTPFSTRDKINQHCNEILCDRIKKQVMRGGHNMSPKVEFSQEKSLHYMTTDNIITTEDFINKHAQNKCKSKTIGPQRLEHAAHHTPIDTKTKLVEKGNSVVTLIKKCASIFKFTRKTNELHLENKNNVISEKTEASRTFPKQNKSEFKSTHGRLSKLPYDLSSHEHITNFCSPGMLSLYERYEENKRRQIYGFDKLKRHEKKQVKSLTSEFCSNTKAKIPQPRLTYQTKDHQKVRHELKEKTACSSSRLPVNEESIIYNNYNFKKKKSSNHLMSSALDTNYKKRVEKFNTKDFSSINGIKNCLSEENKLKKEHKASNLGFILKKCFCRLGFQKKNIPEGEFHWQKPITTQFVQVDHNAKINRHDVTKTLYNIKEPLQSKLSARGYAFKENLIQSQNGMNNPRYNSSQLIPNSSFSRRGHIRSQFDVNFDKMKNLLNIQKINPFYRSFYALNVYVPKTHRRDVYYKQKSRKRELGCEPEECEPRDCSKRYRRLKRWQKKERKRRERELEELKNKIPCQDMKTDKDCYERCKEEFEKRKTKKKQGPDRPLILGSDFKIRAGVYKDTDPYKNSRRQAVRIGSDARIDFDFFREPTKRNICFTGPIPASRLPKDRAMMEESISNFGSKSKIKPKAKPLDTQLYDKRQRRPSGIKLMMKRLSRRPVRLKRAVRSDLHQRMIKSTYSFCGDPTKYKSTPRLPKRREASKTKYVQCKECASVKQKKLSKQIDKNNVTFCTDVNCREFDKDETPKKRASIVSRFTCIKDDQVKSTAKSNRIQGQGKGEGDVEKQIGPVAGNKRNKCLCAVNKIKCKCGVKNPKNCLCGVKNPKNCLCGAKNPKNCLCGAKNPKNCLCEPVTDQTQIPIGSDDKKKYTGSAKPIKGDEELDTPEKCFCTRTKKNDTGSVKRVIGDEELASPQKCFCTRSKKNYPGSGKHVIGDEELASPQKCFCSRSKNKDTRSVKHVIGDEELASPQKCFCSRSKKKDTRSVKRVIGDEELESPQRCFCSRSKKKDTRSVKRVIGDEELASPQRCFCSRSKKKDTGSVKPLKEFDFESAQKCICGKRNLRSPVKGQDELVTTRECFCPKNNFISPVKADKEPEKLTTLQKLFGAKKRTKHTCLCEVNKPVTDQTQVLQQNVQGIKLQSSSEKHLIICKECGMTKDLTKKRKKKKCKRLQEAEREMKTIMPYSKKKFRKRESHSKLVAPGALGVPDATGGIDSPGARYARYAPGVPDAKGGIDSPGARYIRYAPRVQDAKGGIDSPGARYAPGVPDAKGGIDSPGARYAPGALDAPNVNKSIGKVSKFGTYKSFAKVARFSIKEARKHGDKKYTKPPNYDVRISPSFECLCNKEARLRRLCPVCKAKAQGKFTKRKNKLPCTCMEEEIKPEKPKDLSKCPMCKESLKKRKSKKPLAKCPCCKKPFSLADKTGSDKESKLGIEEKPVDNTPRFEMMLNTTNMKIVNKDEVLKRLGQVSKQTAQQEKAELLKKLHGRKCKCCICTRLKKEKQMAAVPITGNIQKIEPCICGSKICKQRWNILKQERRHWELRQGLNLKKCICGSPICEEESQKMPEVLLEEAKLADHKKEVAKRIKKEQKQYEKERKKRAKEREKERKKRDKIRKKQDKIEMKAIKKDQGAGNIRMIAESLIDLGTFGSKAFCDIARFVSRAVRHPTDVYVEMKDATSDPGTAMKRLRQSIEDLGLFATGKRISTRVKKMPATKATIRKMESHNLTNYLLHIASKDPKTRMRKIKRKKTREPMDFKCSPYMASRRKRPCLSVYYKCAWFYPHCLSLIGIWKQIIDILLFVLAVLVWSPCIVCMECCRGFLCCILCQG